MPADLHDGAIARNRDAAIERAARAVLDAELVVGGGDLLAHDVKRAAESHRAQRSFGLLPGTREVAGLAIGQTARRDFDDGGLGRRAADCDVRDQRCNGDRSCEPRGAGE